MDIFCTLCSKVVKQFIKLNEENDSCLILTIDEAAMSETIGDYTSGMLHVDRVCNEGGHFHSCTDEEFFTFLGKYKRRRTEQIETYAEAFQYLID